ncbi:MAG: PAS domain-containing protein [Fidelibacterota bacterium]
MTNFYKQSSLTKHPLMKNLLVMVAFGFMSLLLGEIQFYLPNVIGGASDMREVPLLISVIYLPHWIYMIGVSIITSFGTPPEGSFIATVIMHAVAGPVAWVVYRIFNAYVKNNYLMGFCWIIFVILLYTFILIPLLVTTYIAVDLLPATNIFNTYREILFSVRFEMITTALVSALFIVIVRINKTLQERIKWHDLILRNVNLGFWSRNLADDTVQYHEQWAKMLGYSLEEVQGNTAVWKSLIHPEDKAQALATLNKFLDGTSDSYYSEYRLRTKTREWRWILDQGQAIEYDKTGKVIRCAGTHLDITDRVKMQDIMIQNEKMMSIGGLAAGMAHEINNPIAGIMQNASVILNRLTKNSPKNQEIADEIDVDFEKISAFLEERKIIKMVRLIKETGLHASEIISNMLSFSRKSESKFKEIEIAKTIDDTIKLLENDYDMKKHYDFKNIKIIKNYQPDLTTVHAQESKIKQVIMNILKNGAEAMAEENKPTKSPQFMINVYQENDYISIELENNGPSIPEKDKKRIFEPFFTTKSEGRGTGLGLSISYFIITKDHGGELYIESNESFGVRFIIRLPIHH